MSDKCTCSHHPVVIVPGIGQSKTVMLDENGVKIKNSWPLDIDTKAFKSKIISPLIKSFVLRRDAGCCKALYEAVCEALDPLKCNEDGKCKNDIHVITYNKALSECEEDEKRFIYRMVPLKPLSDVIGEDHMYYFAFNPFGNPYECADSLHEFIQNVKAETGHDKVNIVAISLGAAVSCAYLDKYCEKQDVNRLLGFVPAFGGTSVAKDLLSGEYSRDYENLLHAILGKSEANALCKLLHLLPGDLSVKLFEGIIQAFIDTAVINTPMMWSVVPASCYEKFRDKYISDDAHSELRKIADRAYSVRKDFHSFVRRVRENGIQLFSICGTGLPVFSSPDSVKGSSSDMIVDVSSGSMGAHVAPLGEKLPDSYKQKNPCCGRNHISPDRTVDASAGALPDTTWFFKGTGHEESAHTVKFMSLAKEILSDGFVEDVFSSPAYPQFN